MVKNQACSARDAGSIPGLEEPTCHRASEPRRHKYRASAGARGPRLLTPPSPEPALRSRRSDATGARALHLESGPHTRQEGQRPPRRRSVAVRAPGSLATAPMGTQPFRARDRLQTRILALNITLHENRAQSAGFNIAMFLIKPFSSLGLWVSMCQELHLFFSLS